MKLFKNGIDISDLDEKYLKDRLIDIEDWIHKALLGQIDYCKDEFEKRWMPTIMNDPSIASIPKNKDELHKLIFSHKDYQTRVQREQL